MKILIKAASAAGLLALAACGGGADDQTAANIEATHENRADQIDAMADNASNEAVEDMLEDNAAAIREAGEDAADRADDTDNAMVGNSVAH